jgi:hypothetical protein
MNKFWPLQYFYYHYPFMIICQYETHERNIFSQTNSKSNRNQSTKVKCLVQGDIPVFQQASPAQCGRRHKDLKTTSKSNGFEICYVKLAAKSTAEGG